MLYFWLNKNTNVFEENKKDFSVIYFCFLSNLKVNESDVVSTIKKTFVDGCC
jgi:hypothetical protein